MDREDAYMAQSQFSEMKEKIEQLQAENKKLRVFLEFEKDIASEMLRVSELEYKAQIRRLNAALENGEKDFKNDK